MTTQAPDENFSYKNETDEGRDQMVPTAIHDQVKSRHGDCGTNDETAKQRNDRGIGIAKIPDRQPEPCEVHESQGHTSYEWKQKMSRLSHHILPFNRALVNSFALSVSINGVSRFFYPVPRIKAPQCNTEDEQHQNP